MSSLSDRIRGIVRPTMFVKREAVAQGLSPAAAGLKACASGELEATLGGEWRDGCFIVERRWEPAARYGREAIGTYAACLDQATVAASLFTGSAVARAPFVFFDLETTGLSGGAGTHAFLVGCGWFEVEGAFVTRQFLMTRYADERRLLETVAGELARAGSLVSFNGKSFDAPVLETRYLFHRLAWPAAGTPHVDVLHPARRFWGLSVARPFQGRDRGAEGCSLLALERQVVGARRVGDVPGFEIPARYFQFIRSGDAVPLAAVLEHNRLDLLSLAALTSRLLHVTRRGPEAARDAREALAIGRVYARAGFEERARDAYRSAIDRCRSPRSAFDPVRMESLRLLALTLRRTRRFDEAAACWRELLETRGCPVVVAREAGEALAIHHEHRLRDFAAAKLFALGTLERVEGQKRPGWTEAVQHRLSRIDRKMAT